ASDWRKSSHLLSHLRIMTSDLIIDEIDMFDKSDFLHILRLVYVTGLYGRNLIITTATILPKMADLIYSAYFEGVEQFSLYSDGCSDINISYLSDAINKSITDSSRDYEDGLDLIEDCLIKSSDYYYKEHCVKPKHKVKIIDDIQDDYFSNIVRLHENNKIEDIKNNINYSVGLIRIQNIADCYDVVKKISNSLEFFEKNDCYINVIFYHARLPIAIRSYIESKLDKALYRKGVKDPFMKSDLYRDGLLKNGGRFKNIITLVIASPVIEVGRDFDFDWGIVEPTSSRAIIQTMGRVNRHRDIQVKKENIFIMNKNYRVLRGYGKAYSNYDGNEDIDSIFSGIINNPTSSLILNPEKDSLSFWENEGFGKFVIDSFMGSFFGTSAKMVSDKLVESAWRASSPDEHQYVLDIDEDKFLTVSSVWDNKYREVKLVDENICFNNDGIVNDSMFFINSFNIDEIISSLKDENNDEFNNKFMKINTIKSKNKSVFSKIFGII
ncbi:MAG: hypothetical protein U9N59_08730, partial [Campylobacterota bacterium]|nr:hypothetical protein [Campylobacterota bacterium]